MKLTKLISVIAAGTAALALNPAMASDKTQRGDGGNWLEHTAKATQGKLNTSAARSGYEAPINGATRVIRVDDNTRYVNVESGDTVKFIMRDKAFAWQFDPPGAVQLAQIAPRDFGTGHVVVYVAPNPSQVGY